MIGEGTMSPRLVIALALLLATGGGVAVIALWRAAADETRHVQFVVPEEFRGIIRVTSSPDGTRVRADEQGIYRLVIPASGTLALAPPNVLRGWRRYSCTTTAGKTLPVASEPGGVPPAAIALRHVFDMGTGDGEQDAYYVIGTEQDRQMAESSIFRRIPGERL